MAHELKRAILARYKSIHAFCRQHPELKRSTVYQVLAGKYAGHAGRQLAAIRAALEQCGETADEDGGWE